MPSHSDDVAIFTLTFSKGLADRNRLPIDQVIRTLVEFQEMVKEVGRRVQYRNGADVVDGDFGLELVASSSGLAFKKGSVKALAVATRDLKNAKETLSLIVNNVRGYQKKPVAVVTNIEQATVARRMLKIANLQRNAKTEIVFEFKEGPARAQKAQLTELSIKHLSEATAPLMRVEGVNLFGKLRQLNDRSRIDDESKHFWGELFTEDHQIWRLKFLPQDLPRVIPLFRKQVEVIGSATYFPSHNPRLLVSAIQQDFERDYVAAFDEYRRNPIFDGISAEELLTELRD